MDIERQIKLMDELFDQKGEKEINDMIKAVLSRHREDISVDDYLDSMQNSSPLTSFDNETENSVKPLKRMTRKKHLA